MIKMQNKATSSPGIFTFMKKSVKRRESSIEVRPQVAVQEVKNLPAVQETCVWSLGQEDPLEKGMAAHSSVLVWRFPWVEEPGGLQSMGWQKVGHDSASNFFHYLLEALIRFSHFVLLKRATVLNMPAHASLYLVWGYIWLYLCSKQVLKTKQNKQTNKKEIFNFGKE